VIDSPSGGVPEKDPRWDLSGTEACGGVKSILWTPLRVSGFLGIYSGGIRSNEAQVSPRGTRARLPPQARPGGSWPPPGSSGLLPKILVFVLSNKNLQKVLWHLDVVWY
jgi:hypothetical protein